MISEEIRQQQKKLKDMTLKEKAGYITYYYKWHIIISLIIMAVAGSFIYNLVTKKEDVFFLEVINANVALDGTGDLLAPYREKAPDFDPQKQQMTAHLQRQMIQAPRQNQMIQTRHLQKSQAQARQYQRTMQSL